MIRQLKFMSGLLLAAALAACGGGGGSPGGTPNNPNPGGPTPISPASIEIFTSSPELTSAPNSSLTFTVVAKDANNQAIPNQTVSFSATSGNLIGALPSPSTGANGEPITSVSLTPGSDRSNRTITVTVSAGSARSTVTVPVVGTKLAVSGDGSMLVGGQTDFTVRLVDSAGQAVPNATVNVSAQRGTLGSATVTTNSQGAATVSYRGTSAGQDTITATGLGTTATATILVSADEFRFETPSAGSSIVIGATQTVTVRSLSGGVPQAGQQVNFSTTRGTITPSSVVTDSAGRASAVVSATSSGPANIVAQVANAQVTLAVNFVATQPASLVLQANPGAVAPNSAGSTTNQSTLLATVRDAAGNPVPGRTVNFTAIIDPSNGTISPGTAITDSAGNAQAQFIPGPIATANNGVQLQATVAGTGITGQAVLTVNTQALFITIGTGNVISNFDPQTYEKEFLVYVTDANGAPAGNRQVNIEVFPYQYLKGSLIFSQRWVYDVPTISVCQNEDTNRNGILNPGEDFNGSGRLEPGIPVLVTPATVTTSNAGLATFKIRYGENFAYWIDAEITARASVGGTESTKSLRLTLPASADDAGTNTSTPAFAVSPFGVNSCSTPN